MKFFLHFSLSLFMGWLPPHADKRRCSQTLSPFLASTFSLSLVHFHIFTFTIFIFSSLFHCHFFMEWLRLEALLAGTFTLLPRSVCPPSHLTPQFDAPYVARGVHPYCTKVGLRPSHTVNTCRQTLIYREEMHIQNHTN